MSKEIVILPDPEHWEGDFGRAGTKRRRAQESRAKRGSNHEIANALKNDFSVRAVGENKA